MSEKQTNLAKPADAGKKAGLFTGKRTFTLLAAGTVTAIVSIAILSRSGEGYAPVFQPNPAIDTVVTNAVQLQKSGDWHKSALMLAPLATPDQPVAMLEYAKLLAHGWGVSRDLEHAREMLLSAVRFDFPGRAEAAFELAKVYRKSSGEDCPRIAFEWFTKAAEWGYEKAHIELGKHQARGIGVPVNMKAALEQYQIASRQGSATALIAFLDLVGTNPDITSGLPPVDELVADAIPMLEKEARAGSASSAKALGRMFLNGQLVKVNPVRAKDWLKYSADLGDSGAMTDLALLMLQGTPSVEDAETALDYLRHAAELNNAGALTDLGRLHLEARFGLDPHGAVDLFERGVKAAHAGSMEELARLLLEGKLVPPDRSRAIALLKRGKALGHKGSTSLLEATTASDESEAADFKAVSTAADAYPAPKTQQLATNAFDPAKHTLSGATLIVPFGK